MCGIASDTNAQVLEADEGIHSSSILSAILDVKSMILCYAARCAGLSARCMVDFVTPRGLDPVAPVICPQYAGDGCCSWQQNYALYENLQTLVDR